MTATTRRRSFAAALAAALTLGLAACGGSDDTKSSPQQPAGPSSSASGDTSTGDTSTGDPGATDAASTDPGTGPSGTDPSTDAAPADGGSGSGVDQWVGPGGPIQMPPGPYKKLPATLPQVPGWKAQDVSGTMTGMVTYFPPGAQMLSQGIITNAIPGSQPLVVNGGTIEGKVYCVRSGGVSGSTSCGIPFEGGSISLTVGKELTQAQAFEFGNKLYEAVK